MEWQMGQLALVLTNKNFQELGNERDKSRFFRETKFFLTFFVEKQTGKRKNEKQMFDTKVKVGEKTPTH